MNSVPIYDFSVDQEISYPLSFVYRDAIGAPIDITGYVGRLRVQSGGITYADQPVTIGGMNGRVSVVINTNSFDFKQGKYVVDLTPEGASTFRVLKGTITVDTEWA